MGKSMTYLRDKPVKDYKIRQYEEFKRIVTNYKTVGIVSLQNVDNTSLKELRNILKDFDIFIKVGKKRVMKRVFEELGYSDFCKELDKVNTPALVYTNLNPFKLYKIISSVFTKAYAKGGETVEEDVIVKKGPTELKPGPIMSEFGRFKIRVRPAGNVLEVIQDVKVLKKGDKIQPELASLLMKLKIKTIKVRLNLEFAQEDGIVYKKDILAVSESEYLDMLRDCFKNSLLLSLGIDWITRENVEILLANAIREAKGVAVEVGYSSPDTIEDIIKRCVGIADYVKEKLNV